MVEVDTETGAVELCAWSPSTTPARILNPMLAEGQVHGGLAQGVAQALLEEVRYDEEGNPLTATFADYTVISAAELPCFETRHMETPTPLNPLGAKGIGESGTIGSTPAVHNAVVDALSHLGRAPPRHAGHPRAGLAGHRRGARRQSSGRSTVTRRHKAGPPQSHRVPLAVGRPRFLGQPGTRNRAADDLARARNRPRTSLTSSRP